MTIEYLWKWPIPGFYIWGEKYEEKYIPYGMMYYDGARDMSQFDVKYLWCGPYEDEKECLLDYRDMQSSSKIEHLRKKIAWLEDEIDRARDCLHNPSFLMPELCGLEDRWEKLAEEVGRSLIRVYHASQDGSWENDKG